MKQTKASDDDLALLHELIRTMERRQAGHLVGALNRVLYGYELLVENCCDPKARTLEWKPEIVDAAAKGGLKL